MVGDLHCTVVSCSNSRHGAVVIVPGFGSKFYRNTVRNSFRNFSFSIAPAKSGSKASVQR